MVCLFWPPASLLPMRFTLAPWKFLVDPPRHPVFGPFNTLNGNLTLHTPFFSLSRFSDLICFARFASCSLLVRPLAAKKVWSSSLNKHALVKSIAHRPHMHISRAVAVSHPEMPWPCEST